MNANLPGIFFDEVTTIRLYVGSSADFMLAGVFNVNELLPAAELLPALSLSFLTELLLPEDELKPPEHPPWDGCAEATCCRCEEGGIG